MHGAAVALGMTVWPTFIGVTDGTHEPSGPDYERSPITWRRHKDGTVTGSATILAPKGTWTHHVFLSGPQPDAVVMGTAKMEHPVIFDRTGFIDVNPIRNCDVLPRVLL